MAAVRSSISQPLRENGANLVLKQYGAPRTGTNYLRLLVQANFPNVLVLMHVLGDKHSAPADIPRHDCTSSEHAYEWLRRVTLRRKAARAPNPDAAQETYLRAIAPRVLAAAQSGGLGYLLSIKDPYAWAVSIAVAHHYLPRGLPRAKALPRFLPRSATPFFRTVNEVWASFWLQRACLQFNDRYRAWFALREQFPDRCLVVRYEDLIGDPQRVVSTLAEKFAIPERAAEFRDYRDTIRWTEWDHVPPTLAASPFDADYYRDGRYDDDLTPAMREVIGRTIDWELVRPFGYFRR